MTNLTREDLIKFLKDNLTIDIVTSSEYTGRSDGPMYEDCKQIQLKLNGEIISESYL